MLSDESKTHILEALDTIPDTLSVPVRDGLISKTVEDITTIYELSTEQSVWLENNLYLVFLGLLPLSELDSNLLEKSGLPGGKILDILDSLTTLLLKDEILESLLALDINQPKDNAVADENPENETIDTPPQQPPAEPESQAGQPFIGSQPNNQEGEPEQPSNTTNKN